MGGKRVLCRLWPLFVLLAVLMAVGAAWRFRRTAEGVVILGTGRERTALCRAVPSLSPRRQEWVLVRLLQDALQDVQLGAVSACGRIPPNPRLDAMLEAMLRDEDCPGDVRTKAAEVLLSREPVPRGVVKYLEAACRREEFRRAHPLLAGHFAAWRLPAMDDAELRDLIARSFNEDDPTHVHLRRLVLDHIETFKPLREAFVERIDGASYGGREYALDCLTAIDGVMRGRSADDWRSSDLSEADPDAPHAFEAEWAHEIRPNYQVGHWQGIRCLRLGEGAGGRMGWLKGYDATVDVGTARFSMWAPRDGTYRLWAHVYLHDKCSNSFGIYMDDKRFTNFRDAESTLGAWHWLLLRHDSDTVRLKRGLHRMRLEAWEDGCYIDRFVLLPVGGEARKPSEVAPAVHWDPGFRHSLSFSVEAQSQCRGTTQVVTVWVRRSTPELTRGTVTLEVPAPFEMAGPGQASVAFDGGNPLARTSFQVRLPDAVVVGEGIMRATYRNESGDEIEGRMIRGGQFDWLTTGPLSPSGERYAKLRGTRSPSGSDLESGWQPYPAKGCDPYRRLDFEMAWGQLQGKYIYLCTDVRVEKTADYLALLTADDTAHVFIDGAPAISQEQGGPGEGRMVTRRLRLTRGEHRLFVRVYQAHKPEPTGPDAGRSAPNHCNLKLLIRRSRHEHAPEIKGLPWPDGPRPDAPRPLPEPEPD